MNRKILEDRRANPRGSMVFPEFFLWEKPNHRWTIAPKHVKKELCVLNLS